MCIRDRCYRIRADMTELVWHSSFASLTGYSGSSLAFVLGLDARGVRVRPLYLYAADHEERLSQGHLHPRIAELQKHPLHLDLPQVVYAPGDRLGKNSGRYRIGFTMVETDSVPADWVVPVSYTHLDVYKRQALAAAPASRCRNLRFAAPSGAGMVLAIPEPCTRKRQSAGSVRCCW